MVRVLGLIILRRTWPPKYYIKKKLVPLNIIKRKKKSHYISNQKKQCICENETQRTSIVVSNKVSEDEDGVQHEFWWN